MKTIHGQVLASTEVDAHGEQRDKQFLDDLLTRMPSRMPLNQHHDMGKPTVGFIENFRVEADGTGWALKGDVTFDGTPPDAGGFSFSTTEAMIRTEEALFSIYVPYPYYADEPLLRQLATSNANTTVGRWIKKSVSVGEVALIISGIGLIFGPAWKKVYDDKVHPHLANLVSSMTEALQKKNGGRDVRVEYLQPITIPEYQGLIELYFIPSEHVDLGLAYGFAVKEAVDAGMTLVQSDWESTRKPIRRLVHVFEPEACRYRATQVIYVDGDTRAL
jgi:hypothetical protein